MYSDVLLEHDSLLTNTTRQRYKTKRTVKPHSSQTYSATLTS